MNRGDLLEVLSWCSSCLSLWMRWSARPIIPLMLWFEKVVR